MTLKNKRIIVLGEHQVSAVRVARAVDNGWRPGSGRRPAMARGSQASADGASAKRKDTCSTCERHRPSRHFCDASGLLTISSDPQGSR